MFSGSGGNRSVVLRGCRDLNLELDFGRLTSSATSKKPGATLRLKVSRRWITRSMVYNRHCEIETTLHCRRRL